MASVPGAGGSRGGHTPHRPAVGTPPATLRPALGKRRACRRPARRASSNCRFRCSICCFRRSFSRCRRSFLRCCLFASRSRPVNFSWSRSRSVCRSAIRCGGAFRSAVVTPPLCHNPSQNIDTPARNPNQRRSLPGVDREQPGTGTAREGNAPRLFAGACPHHRQAGSMNPRVSGSRATVALTLLLQMLRPVR